MRAATACLALLLTITVLSVQAQDNKAAKVSQLRAARETDADPEAKRNRSDGKKKKGRRPKAAGRGKGQRKAAEKGRMQGRGIVVKGNDCEYITLKDITGNSGCSTGQKFVLKGASGVRRQFLIVSDNVILAFVTKKKKFTECTAFTDITTSVTCKSIAGLDSVDLSVTAASNSSATDSAATTAAGAAATTAAGAAATTAAGAAATTAAGGAATTASGETTAAAAATTAAAAATTAAAGATTAAGAAATTAAGSTEDDEVVTRVKGYIDAGTCGSITASSSCGSSASSYYKEISYGGRRVLITNQVPDHEHEEDMLSANPNTACERLQFISLPIDPAKGTATRTGLGTVGLAVTGGAFFNDWSSPEGDIALVNEGPSLDSCFGHSAAGGAYHYHANIACSAAGAATGANDPDTCKLIGYYQDGVPVYGLCRDSSGVDFTSCYSCTGSCTSSVTTVGGSFSNLGADDSDYTYSQAAFTAGTCNLDAASGAVHPGTGQYSYFMTSAYPWTPVYLAGDQGTGDYCSAD